MRPDLLTTVLKDLIATSNDIEASGIVSTDGLMIASVLPANMDAHRVAAITATMLSLADKIALELTSDAMDQMLIKSAKGSVLLTYVGEDVGLVVLVKPDAKLELILQEIGKAIESISGLPKIIR
jgi:uncharacterized protein